jgi:hypothetical protein
VEPRFRIGDCVAVGYNPARARFLPHWSAGVTSGGREEVGLNSPG